MKKLIYKMLSVAVIGASVITSSCSEDILDKINENPNSPTQVPLSLVLPVVETEIAYSVVGGDMSLYAGVWSQLVTGVHAQLHAADRFVYTNSLVNNTWTSAYANALKNLREMELQAIEEENTDYQAVINILQAYTYSIVTDSWGRVPYLEAAGGFESRTPSFDSQEQIYTGENGLLARLDQAISLIDAGGSVGTVGAQDLIYGGDMELWKKAAYGLKAKFISRLANTSHYDAQAVIDAGNNSFAHIGESFVFDAFGDGATDQNPWYQESTDRSHFAVSQSFFNLLEPNEDPRGHIFFNEGYESVPAPNGAANQDQAGDIYTKMYDYVRPGSPIPFYTYDQLKFHMAEAYLNLNQNEDAKEALEEGIEAAVERAYANIGESADEEEIEEYLSQSAVNPAAESLTKEDVWEQYYISLYPFQSIEAFAFYRRTDYPNLTNPEGSIPRRFPYPQSELDNNAENVPSVQRSTGVWWDELSE